MLTHPMMKGFIFAIFYSVNCATGGKTLVFRGADIHETQSEISYEALLNYKKDAGVTQKNLVYNPVFYTPNSIKGRLPGGLCISELIEYANGLKLELNNCNEDTDKKDFIKYCSEIIESLTSYSEYYDSAAKLNLSMVTDGHAKDLFFLISGLLKIHKASISKDYQKLANHIKKKDGLLYKVLANTCFYSQRIIYDAVLRIALPFTFLAVIFCIYLK